MTTRTTDQTRNEVRIFRPTRAAVCSSILWDCAAVAPSALLAVTVEKPVWRIIFAVIAVGLALWMGCVSWGVLRTHFVTSQEGIVTAGAAYSFGLRWEEIADVLIRERPAGMQIERADRLVVLKADADRTVPLNTSVLSRPDEEALLAIIRNGVHCPIRTITDRMWSLRRDTGSPE